MICATSPRFKISVTTVLYQSNPEHTLEGFSRSVGRAVWRFHPAVQPLSILWPLFPELSVTTGPLLSCPPYTPESIETTQVPPSSQPCSQFVSLASEYCPLSKIKQTYCLLICKIHNINTCLNISIQKLKKIPISTQVDILIFYIFPYI